LLNSGEYFRRAINTLANPFYKIGGGLAREGRQKIKRLSPAEGHSRPGRGALDYLPTAGTHDLACP
jgi:hypothetical protein